MTKPIIRSIFNQEPPCLLCAQSDKMIDNYLSHLY